MKNKQWVLNKRPSGVPNLEEDLKINISDTKELDYGDVLIQTKYLSLDPYMRGRMNGGPSYSQPVEIGGVMEGEVVGKVVESKSKLFDVGEMVNAKVGWQEYACLSEKNVTKISQDNDLPITYSLGVLGMPGRTAYLGFLEVCKPKPGETIVVSAASGAVGSLVGQIAKLMGCNVIGIAGTEEKVNYCKDILNFDYCLNYKTQDIDKELGLMGENFINMYFDNVGGEISDAVMNHLATYSRTAICGQIANYNASVPPLGPRVARTLLTKQSTMQGFIVFNFEHKYIEAMDAISKWIKSGEIVYKEDIYKGFDDIPKTFMKLFEGENFGKLIVDIT
jgi:hypothetical protein